MGGIAGMVGFDHPVQSFYGVAGAMLETLVRRGPDESGVVFDEHVCLLSRRLAVVDAAGGRQPMELSHGGRRCRITYNGELYNTEELRLRLLRLGHVFRGYGDTEVLLTSYLEWGADCLQELNGIYAFAIWDEGDQLLFCARDRMGVKPLFYALEHEQFIFGSEIKTLLAHPYVRPVLRREGAAELLLVGPGRTPGFGVFHGIHELKPGHYALYDRTGLHIAPYFELRAQEHAESLEETVEHTRALVFDAIKRQLACDVPMGVFLSGGLDSSIVAAVAAQESSVRELRTWSVEYAENDRFFQKNFYQPDRDGPYIALMTQRLGGSHTTVTLEPETLAASLFRAVDARDLPGMADIDGSLLLLCEEVRREAVVALSGEGADEIFGGYPWYRDEALRMTDGFPWSQSTEYRADFLRPELLDGLDAAAFVHEKYRAAVEQTSLLSEQPPPERRMKELMRLNVDWFMQTLAERSDRMSQYSGLELRMPFCDHRLVEYLYNVPWEFKEYQGREKGLLRRAMEGLLPDEVLWRKKSPYPKIHHPAFLTQVSALLQQIADNPHSPLLELVRRDALLELLKTTREIPWYGQLMTTPQTIAYFVQINYWLQRYKVQLDF